MNTMHLVLFVHGSRDPRWCAPFERLVASLNQEGDEKRVHLAYQQFIPPTLLEVAAEARQQGILRLRLLPLFMSAGQALERDIETQVTGVQERFPEMQIEVLPNLSEDAQFWARIGEIVHQAMGA